MVRDDERRARSAETPIVGALPDLPGIVAVMHWIPDERTPRGPALSIRPRPEQCAAWLRAAGFESESQVIDLPPFHYGLFAHRRN